MLKPTVIFFLFIMSGWLQSQSLPKSERKKADRYAREAQGFFDTDDYYHSLQNYKYCLAIDPLHERAGTNAAICIQKLGYPVDSSLFLLENLSLSKQLDANFYLALIKHQQRKFDEAILLLQTYKKMPASKRLNSNQEIDYRIGISRNAKEFISSPNDALIKNMGPAINTRFNDYVPVVDLEENTLYFTSKREGSTGHSLNTDKSYFEDVYVSHKKNGVWQNAENIGPPINSETNDACVALSYDGHSMLVYRTSENLESGDLYMSRINENNQWSELKKLPDAINSPFAETSACFSKDSTEIFFSSNRTGGFGGKDIYRIKRLPNGEWSWAYNLGAEINTPYDDDAPFLHPDGVTLFFSSTGHNSMGKYDVFSSKYDAEENVFYQIKNLGYPINDINNDIFFVLSLDAQRAYYTSEKPDSYGGTDIYTIDTRYKPNDLVVVRGNVKLDSLPLRAKISLFEMPGNLPNGTYSSNPANGNFILVLNPYRNYLVLVEAEGCEDIKIDLNAPVMTVGNPDLLIELKKSNAR